MVIMTVLAVVVLEVIGHQLLVKTQVAGLPLKLHCY